MIRNSIVHHALAIYIDHRKKASIPKRSYHLTTALQGARKDFTITNLSLIIALLVSNLSVAIVLLILSIKAMLIKLWKVDSLQPYLRIPCSRR
jgi:hypothetical protein